MSTFRRIMSIPRMSCPIQCPKPHHAPKSEARTELLPSVRGVRACSADQTLFFLTSVGKERGVEEIEMSSCIGNWESQFGMRPLRRGSLRGDPVQKGNASILQPDPPKHCCLPILSLKNTLYVAKNLIPSLMMEHTFSSKATKVLQID